MNLPEWPWQKIAIVAAAAVVVTSVGFLSGKTGPVQGASGSIMLLRTDVECLVSVNLHLGDMHSAGAEWNFFATADYCTMERELLDSKITGRESISESIKAAVGE